MKLKYSDIDIDSISYEDEVGDLVLYPNDINSPMYTISSINTDQRGNVTYSLIAEDDGAVIIVPFEDCLHIASRLEHSRYQVDAMARLKPCMQEAIEFLEIYDNV